MWNLVTLDGYFNGPRPGDLDWHDEVWGEELEQFSLEQLRAADLILFGRVTYQGMAAYWPSAEGEVADLMNSSQKVVFSRTLERADWSNTRLVRGPVEEEVARLKQEPGKDILIFGSADLSAALTRHRLIDEYRLCVTPLILSGGEPLFKPGSGTLRLALVSARPLKTGGVILSYRPAAAA